jgi:phosphorylcholine metabolism protein LicD
MKFASTYFQDEVKSGFFVPGMVKRGWAAQLEVLNEVDKLCQKHNIQYFAEWGTLLGTVRHQGFIPWDDDLDICMKREDYRRFIEIAKTELPPGYDIANVYTDIGFTDMLTRVLNERTIRMDDAFLEQYHDFPYVAGLDVFPLDFIAPNEQDDQMQIQLLDIVATFSNSIDEKVVEWGAATEYIQQIEQMCGCTFDKTKPLQQQLLILIDRLSGLYTEEEAEYITLMPLWKDHHTYRFPKEYYAQSIRMPFENLMIPVPIAYDEILKRKYGDYMRLVKSGGGHDYPFFRKQEKILKERTGIQLKKYAFPGSFPQREHVADRHEERKKKEVLFLPYQASKWDGLASLWKAACEDPDTNAVVMPIPYLERGFKGNVREIHYERDLFPEEVDTVSYQDYNMQEHHPDIIFIQDPCDEYNPTLSVHPDYFSRNIYAYTDRLVYVPWFVQDDFDEQDERSIAGMDYYCTMPGLVYADEILVQSEQMKRMYVQKLTKWAGDDTKAIWEQKILPSGLPIQDKLNEEKQRKPEVPEEWKPIVYRNDGSKRKLVLYATNASHLAEHGNNALCKLNKVLETFKENREEVVLIWRPHPQLQQLTENAEPRIWAEYEYIVEQYQTEGWGIYDSGLDPDRIVQLADAYYGDPGELAHQFSQEKKPVMIQNFDI